MDASAQRKDGAEYSSAMLLEIAADMFREKGVAHTTMRGIAARAGMKASSIYYHFPSKDAIIDHILDRSIAEAITRIQQALAELPQEAGFRVRLCAAVTAYLATVNDYGTFFTVTRQLRSQVSPEIAERNRQRRIELDRIWADLFAEGHRAGDITISEKNTIERLFLLGALNWATEWMDTSRKSPAELGQLATSLFMDGIAPR